MSPITVLITIAAYFSLLFGISWWVGRGSNNAEFFNGGRQSKWYMVAFAMIGSMISGVTFVSVPGMVQTADYGYLQMVLGFIVGQLLIAYVLVPLFYRMNLTSIYEYLEQRFGITTYKTGAWFFFISKMLGAAVRFYLVCLTLQLLVFGPLGLPFVLNIACSMFLVWLYTAQGGVKSIIWADTLKSACLIISVVLSIYFIAADLNLDFSSLCSTVWNEHDFVFLNNVNAPQFFWKQFLAGIFTMIATNGLDQDMMQRNLSCRNSKDAQKNMITSGLMQLPVIALFLFLGTLLYLYAEKHGIAAVKDELFPTVATQGGLPAIVGVLFIIGLVAAAYNAAGSALTALTTSFTLDILHARNKTENALRKLRKHVHIALTIVMGIVIFAFNLFNNTSVIDAVYKLASYTYGPILGLFAFGIFTKFIVRDKLLPFISISAPILCFILDKNSVTWFNGYKFSYEILILNATFTFIGMLIISKGKQK
ncbi:MAG: sodium:solute symporter [Bacteroidaceae bacterium]|nr:sodium:solute symporter [Bacteroidaceae bacterium]